LRPPATRRSVVGLGVGERPPPVRSNRRHLWEALAVAGAAAILGAFYLGIYPAKHYRMPIGYDTPLYLSQIRFAQDRGLTAIPERLPFPSTIRASRGLPITVLTLTRLFRTSTFAMVAVVPIVAAIALAVGGGALVPSALRRPPWEGATTAVIVGSSLVVVRLLAPETYTDNLMAAALFVAALVPLLSLVGGEGGWLSAMALLGIGGLIHTTSFVEMTAVLVLLALIYAPASWAATRGGGRHLYETPTVRIATVTAGGASIVGALSFGLLRAPLDTP